MADKKQDGIRKAIIVLVVPLIISILRSAARLDFSGTNLRP